MKKGIRTGVMLLLCFFFCLGSSTYAQNVFTKEQTSGIETSITQVMKDWRIPGVAIAIIKDSEVVYAKGFGYRDLDRKLEVTPETIFAIRGSVRPDIFQTPSSFPISTIEPSLYP